MQGFWKAIICDQPILNIEKLFRFQWSKMRFFARMHPIEGNRNKLWCLFTRFREQEILIHQFYDK
jgi:hypothetical protein